LTVTTFSEDTRTNRSLKYWRSRPPFERVAAVEFPDAFLQNERAAGRPKDLADVDALREPEE
jgi:hypothetical protein